MSVFINNQAMRALACACLIGGATTAHATIVFDSGTPDEMSDLHGDNGMVVSQQTRPLGAADDFTLDPGEIARGFRFWTYEATTENWADRVGEVEYNIWTDGTAVNGAPGPGQLLSEYTGVGTLGIDMARSAARTGVQVGDGTLPGGSVDPRNPYTEWKFELTLDKALDPANDPELDFGTRYWISVNLGDTIETADPGLSGLLWAYTDDSVDSFGTFSFTNSQGQDVWVSTGTAAVPRNYAFQLTDNPIPLPPTPLLLAAGVLLAGITRRNRAESARQG